MRPTEIDPHQEAMEEAVGALYLAFYKMRKSKLYQREYDEMGVLISMLTKDRQYMREHYDIEV